MSARVAAVAASFGLPEEAPALTAKALERRDYRRRHSGKTCDRCREIRPVSAFSRDARNRDGLRRYCRDCDAAGYRSRRVNTHSA